MLFMGYWQVGGVDKVREHENPKPACPGGQGQGKFSKMATNPIDLVHALLACL